MMALIITGSSLLPKETLAADVNTLELNEKSSTISQLGIEWSILSGELEKNEFVFQHNSIPSQTRLDSDVTFRLKNPNMVPVDRLHQGFSVFRSELRRPIYDGVEIEDADYKYDHREDYYSSRGKLPNEGALNLSDHIVIGAPDSIFTTRVNQTMFFNKNNLRFGENNLIYTYSGGVASAGNRKFFLQDNSFLKKYHMSPGDLWYEKTSGKDYMDLDDFSEDIRNSPNFKPFYTSLPTSDGVEKGDTDNVFNYDYTCWCRGRIQ